MGIVFSFPFLFSVQTAFKRYHLPIYCKSTQLTRSIRKSVGLLSLSLFEHDILFQVGEGGRAMVVVRVVYGMDSSCDSHDIRDDISEYMFHKEEGGDVCKDAWLEA